VIELRCIHYRRRVWEQ